MDVGAMGGVIRALEGGDFLHLHAFGPVVFDAASAASITFPQRGIILFLVARISGGRGKTEMGRKVQRPQGENKIH